jgi:hypothetical protein
VSHIADELGFKCYQTQHGIWVKERPDGRRGPCVADEAVLWQALQAATGGKPEPTVDLAALVKENEQISAAYERLDREAKELQVANEAWRRECDRLVTENLRLQDNQRKRPGRKPRPRSDAGPAGGPEALAAPEQDPLDEDL